MVHQYKLNGFNIVLDTCSGSIHAVDEVAYDIIAMYKSKSAEEGIDNALEIVNSHDFSVPEYLRLTPVGLEENEKYDYSRLDVIEKIQYLPSLIKSMKFYSPNYKSGPYELSLIKNYERLSKIERTNNLKELYKKK